jgi:hypothetical protein
VASDEEKPQSIEDVKADVPDEVMPTWESQAVQYPRKGPAGISYFRGQATADYHVDCLLYRNDDGELVGILNRFPRDFPPYERAGAINVWVRPDHQRRGIATDLAYECSLRWKMPEEGKLTQAGLDLLKGLIDKYTGTDVDYAMDGWEQWHSRMEAQRGEGAPLPTPRSVREARKSADS